MFDKVNQEFAQALEQIKSACPFPGATVSVLIENRQSEQVFVFSWRWREGERFKGYNSMVSNRYSMEQLARTLESAKRDMEETRVAELVELGEKELERMIRQLRVEVCKHDMGSAEEAVVHAEMDRVLAALARARREQPKGFYSGLTRRELAATGTCEADWF